MAYLSEKKFDFVSSALPADTFGVVRFKGTEGFSMCYEFEVDLVSKNAEIDLTEVLKNPVTFTILREDGDIPFHGILTQFEQLHEVDEYVFYRAVLKTAALHRSILNSSWRRNIQSGNISASIVRAISILCPAGWSGRGCITILNRRKVVKR
jgi:uncharacterized protein involved in type VI secretion and phage assembly